jgi:hypothetical protein
VFLRGIGDGRMDGGEGDRMSCIVGVAFDAVSQED